VADTDGDRLLTFAEKVNQVFETVHPPGRPPYTNREVSRWLEENSTNGEPTLSENYIGLLRTGKSRNPTIQTIEALARFFGIPPAYFLENGASSSAIHEELQLIASLRDAKVHGIAARAAMLDPDMRSWLHDMVSTLPTGRPLGKQRDRGRRHRFEELPEEDLDAW